MKKVLLKVMTRDGQIQEGIVEMVPCSCTPLYLYCKLDEGVKMNCLVLDDAGDVKISNIEYVKPYMIDTEEVPTQQDDTPKGEKFHRSAVIKENIAKLFSIDFDELFDSEIIDSILELQKQKSHEKQ